MSLARQRADLWCIIVLYHRLSVKMSLNIIVTMAYHYIIGEQKVRGGHSPLYAEDHRFCQWGHE